MTYFFGPSPAVVGMPPQLNDKPGLMGAYHSQSNPAFTPVIRPNGFPVAPNGSSFHQSSHQPGAAPNMMMLGPHPLSAHSPLAAATPGPSPHMNLPQTGTGAAPLGGTNQSIASSDDSNGTSTAITSQLPTNPMAPMVFSSTGNSATLPTYMPAMPCLYVNTATPPAAQCQPNIASYQQAPAVGHPHAPPSMSAPSIITPQYTVRPTMSYQPTSAPGLNGPATSGQVGVPPGYMCAPPGSVAGSVPGAYVTYMTPTGPVVVFQAAPLQAPAQMPPTISGVHPAPVGAVGVHPAPLGAVGVHPAPVGAIGVHPPPVGAMGVQPTPVSAVGMHPPVGAMTGPYPQYPAAPSIAPPSNTCYLRPPQT